jgi:ABC-type lipoprotein export system ATPase subunit
LIVVTHDLRLAQRMDRIVEIEGGVLRERGANRGQGGALREQA